MRGKVLLLGFVLLLPAAAAQADATTETALRAALQQATSQIANLENQLANLQASQAPDTAMIEALKAQVQTLQKATPAPPVTATTNAKANDKALASLRRELTARSSALGQSQQAYAVAAAAAEAKTAANMELSAQLAALRKANNSCDAKNVTLFKLGNQILDAYSHKDDVFGVVANREPFIGFKRVQLQNVVQDDQQTMLDNQIMPDQSGR